MLQFFDPRLWFVGIIAALAVSNANAFDYDSYQPENLDVTLKALQSETPETGVNIFTPPVKRKLEVKLAAYAEDCNTGFLKDAMMMIGIRPPENVSISKCIKVKSPQGQTVSMYIQDGVAAYLPEEVPLDASLTLYVAFIYVRADGPPGVLVNEFESISPDKSAWRHERPPTLGFACGSPANL